MINPRKTLVNYCDLKIKRSRVGNDRLTVKRNERVVSDMSLCFSPPSDLQEVW